MQTVWRREEGSNNRGQERNEEQNAMNIWLEYVEFAKIWRLKSVMDCLFFCAVWRTQRLRSGREVTMKSQEAC